MAAKAYLEKYVGLRAVGGCDDCHAEQELQKLREGVFVLHTFHDDGCPSLVEYQRDEATS